MAIELDGSLEGKLGKYLDHAIQESQKKWYQTGAAILSIPSILFGIYGMVSKEVTQVTATAELEAKEGVIATQSIFLKQADAKVEALEEEYDLLAQSVRDYKVQESALILENLKQLSSAIHIQGNISASEADLKVARSKAQKLAQEVVSQRLHVAQLRHENALAAERAYELAQRASTLSAQLGALEEYIDEKGNLSPALIAELLSIRVVVEERSWYNLMSPYQISLYLEFPDAFADKIAHRIKSVSYETKDIVLTHGGALSVVKQDNQRNWVATYIGQFPPSYPVAEVTLKTTTGEEVIKVY